MRFSACEWGKSFCHKTKYQCSTLKLSIIRGNFISERTMGFNFTFFFCSSFRNRGYYMATTTAIFSVAIVRDVKFREPQTRASVHKGPTLKVLTEVINVENIIISYSFELNI